METNILITDFGKDHWSLLGYFECRIAPKENWVKGEVPLDVHVGSCVAFSDLVDRAAGACPGCSQKGYIDYSHLRINPARHVLLGRCPFGTKWESSYGTRLKGFWNADETTNPERQLPDHDDVDCAEDLEAAGLIVLGTYVSGAVFLTPEGIRVARLIREHKAVMTKWAPAIAQVQHGSFGTFEYVPPAAVPE